MSEKENLRTVNIVKVVMSTPSKMANHEDIDEMTVKNTYAYDKKKRDDIERVRSKYRTQYQKMCLPFHGMFVCKDDDRDPIMKIVVEARHGLQTIDPQLDANATFIPLVADEQAQGEVYRAVTNAIFGFIYKTLNDRLVELAKLEKVPEVSRLALIRLCEKMRAWNVLADPAVEQTIANFKTQFEAGVIAPVAADVAKQVAQAKAAGAFVEL